jgi:hypothetical protein
LALTMMAKCPSRMAGIASLGCETMVSRHYRLRQRELKRA